MVSLGVLVIIHLLSVLFPVDTSWSWQEAALCGGVSCGVNMYQPGLSYEQGT